MEAKWSALVSYGLSTRMLQDFLPVDERLSPSTVRNHTIKAAERCEKELGQEKAELVSDRNANSDKASEPNPINVGIDGGYLRQWHKKGRNFAVIVGKSVPTEGRAKCFGAVQQHDTDPQQRLLSLLLSQGLSWGQSVRFLSAGEAAIRELQLRMGPYSEHVLDWFHVTMRFTVLKQYVKGLVRLEKNAEEYKYSSPAYDAQKKVDSAKWKLWHGKVEDALERIEDLSFIVANFEERYPKYKKLEKTIEELLTYIDRNRRQIPDYGQAYRSGQVISTAFIESLVNSLLDKRFSKRQQMQWTPRGAHLLLQIRTRLANGELRDTFRRWYPHLSPDERPRAPVAVNNNADIAPESFAAAA